MLTHESNDHGKKKLPLKCKLNKAMPNQNYLELLLSRL